MSSASVNLGNRRQLARKVSLLFCLLLFLLLPLFANDYYLAVLISMATSIILAFGFRLIWTVGRFSLGHMAFMGMGAYTSGILAVKLGVSSWAGLVLGGVVAAFVALMVGAIVLRVGGIYFVIITLALAEIVRYFLSWAKPVTGGAIGLMGIPHPVIDLPGLPRLEFGTNYAAYYYLIVAIALISIMIMYRLETSRIGLAFHAMRQNDQLAEHLGVNIARYRLLAFTTACFFAGVVGSFRAHFQSYISPDDYGLMESIFIQMYAIIGGLASPIGPVVGTFFMIGIYEGLRATEEVQYVMYGVVLLLVMLFLRGGLVSLPQTVRGGTTGFRARLTSIWVKLHQ